MNVRRRILVAIGIPLGMALTVITAGLLGVRFNLATDSLPYGLYRIVPAGKGNDLLVCPTGIAESVTVARGYRPKSLGCGDGYAPLLKPIAARAGDTVSISDRGISVNGKLLPNTKQFPADGHGRPLPVMPHRTYTVESNTVWLVSTYNRYSFDSRYFGPVSLNGKVRYATPLWLF